MQRSQSRLAASGGAALLAALALAGCGGGGGSFNSSNNNGGGGNTPNAAEVLYVADAGNKNIPVISLSSTGTPAQLGTAAGVPSGSTPQDLILDPSRKFVIVASTGASTQLLVYPIQANGSLPSAPTQTATLPSLSGTTHSALSAITTANGEFVYVAGSTTNALYAFQLNTTTGALTQVANAVPTTGSGSTLTPSSLVAYSVNTPSNTFLLVGDTTPNAVNYIVNADGTLTPAAILQAGNSGPVIVSAPIQSTGGLLVQNLLYGYDNGVDALYSYSVSSSGILTETSDVAGSAAASSLVVNPTGAALYLSQAGGTHIYEYPLTTSGANAGQPGTLATTTVTGASLEGAAVDPAGRFLGVLDATAGTPRVVVYSLGTGGAVGSPLATYALATGTDPVAVATNLLNAS